MYNSFQVHPVGSTGNSRVVVANVGSSGSVGDAIEVEFKVEAVGAGPTVTFAVEGLVPGGDPAVSTDWVVLALLTSDSTVAASNSAITVSSVGLTRRWIDGLDKRFFDSIAVHTTANTNVTYSSVLKISPN